MGRNQNRKLYSLQYLRAIAAIAVVLVHASMGLAGRQGARLPFGPGSYGVDLFFVISGFVMFYTTADRPTTPGRFFLRRCIRIVPIYFVLTTVAFGLAVLAPRMTNIFSAAPLDYLRSILFVPYINPATNDIRPELAQGWTLNYEMFFYVVFACCLWIQERYRVVACVAVFIVLAGFGLAASPSGIFGKTYTDPILLEFVFGVLIGYCLLRRAAGFSRLVLVLAALAVTAIGLAAWGGMSWRVLIAGLPAAAAVAGFIQLEERELLPHWPFLMLIGDASYSLYLTHLFVVAILKRVFVRLLDPRLLTSHVIYILSTLGCAIVVSIVFYRAVESPVNRWLQAMAAHKEAQPAPQVEVAAP